MRSSCPIPYYSLSLPPSPTNELRKRRSYLDSRIIAVCICCPQARVYRQHQTRPQHCRCHNEWLPHAVAQTKRLDYPCGRADDTFRLYSLPESTVRPFSQYNPDVLNTVDTYLSDRYAMHTHACCIEGMPPCCACCSTVDTSQATLETTTWTKHTHEQHYHSAPSAVAWLVYTLMVITVWFVVIMQSIRAFGIKCKMAKILRSVPMPSWEAGGSRKAVVTMAVLRTLDVVYTFSHPLSCGFVGSGCASSEQVSQHLHAHVCSQPHALERAILLQKMSPCDGYAAA